MAGISEEEMKRDMKRNNRDKRTTGRLLAGLLMTLVTSQTAAQVDNRLAELGMENIRTVQTAEGTTVAYEDRAYRSSYEGVGRAIQTALEALETDEALTLTVLDGNGLPQLCIVLDKELVRDYRNGTADLKAVFGRMELSRNTDQALERLKDAKTQTRSSWRPDLTVYPQIFLENSRFDKLYRYYLGVAPALEIPLWKGGELTAQVIIPIVGNLKGEQSQVRPGCVVLSQGFYLKRNWTLTLAAGQFTNHRLGGAAEINWRTDDGRWEAGAKTGVTIYSIFVDKKWTVTRKPKLNASVYGRAYIPQWNTEVTAEAARFVYGDYGVKGSVVRHFGEYTVGVYALYTDGEVNGGFNFAIPLPGRKYKRWHGMRIKPSDYLTFQYSMVAYGDYIDRKLGIEYNTVPGKNRSKGFYQPDYIRYFLIRHCDLFEQKAGEKKKEK